MKKPQIIYYAEKRYTYTGLSFKNLLSVNGHWPLKKIEVICLTAINIENI